MSGLALPQMEQSTNGEAEQDRHSDEQEPDLRLAATRAKVLAALRARILRARTLTPR
jgi:hypothetical protein